MKEKKTISFALPKGRLAEKTLDLLVKLNLTSVEVIDFSSRRLIFEDSLNKLRFFLIRNADVVTYVQQGVADFGVVGKDILEESEADVFEYYNLGFGGCRLSVAAPEPELTGYYHNIKVATTFPNITKRFFSSKGIFVEIIKLYGSVELAPLTRLSDLIVDIVDSGETLRKNGLFELETIMESSARFIGNKNLNRYKHHRVKDILGAIGKYANN